MNWTACSKCGGDGLSAASLAEVSLAVFGFGTFSFCFLPPKLLKSFQIHPKYSSSPIAAVQVCVTNRQEQMRRR